MKINDFKNTKNNNKKITFAKKYLYDILALKRVT